MERNRTMSESNASFTSSGNAVPSYVPSQLKYEPNKEVNVNEHDLERLLDEIEETPERNSMHDNIFYAAIGIAGSSVYQLLSFAASGNVPVWAWGITIFLLVSAAVVAAYEHGCRNGEETRFDAWKTRNKREILHMLHRSR